MPSRGRLNGLRVAPQLRGRSELELLRAIDDGLAYVDDSGTVVPFIFGSTAYTTAVITTDSALYYWTLNTTSGSDPNLGSAGVLAMSPSNMTTQSATGAFTGSGTAWQGGGTNSFAQSGGLTLAFPILTAEYWMLKPSFANDDALAMEYSANYPVSPGGFIMDPNSASGLFGSGFGYSGTPSSWTDNFTRPSAAAWHHYVHVFDRTNKVNKVYVDAVLQSLSTGTHTAGTYGNFPSGLQLNLMSRNGASLFAACTMQHVAIYNGELAAARVTAHYEIAIPPPVITSYGPLTARTLAA